jgi:hypothetical protein
MMTLLACGDQRPPERVEANPSFRPDSASEQQTSTIPEEEPTQWTLKEVAKRLTDGGLVITDSGRASVRHSFLAVDGRRMRVSGSELQVFIYPDPASRKADSDQLDTARAAPPGAPLEWTATPHLIASGNLIAIHLTPSGRLAERVRLILEAWHAGS